MKAIDLSNTEHAVFEFLRPTDQRINRSVAWVAQCRQCGQKQLVGASQVRCGQHAACISCTAQQEINHRSIDD
jgi:hypothetical protein